MAIHLSPAACILIAMWMLALLNAARDHGKQMYTVNFWRSFVSCLITFSLLAWGGFFK